MRKVALQATQGRGFARPGLGPTEAEVYPQPGPGQISGEDFSHPGFGQTREVGAPTPGLGQTDAEGSALANGQNTNATNASSTSRQFQADFSSASASGDHTPKPTVQGQAPVGEAKEANSTASISTMSSSPRAADDSTAGIHRLEAIMERTRKEDRERQDQLRMESDQRHHQQMMASEQRHHQQMMTVTTKMQRQHEEAWAHPRGPGRMAS